MKTKLLDCTIRDGGYQNDWEFGKPLFIDHLETLNIANLDFIELGFLDSTQNYDKNRMLFTDIKELNDYSKYTDRFQSKLLLMIDFGKYPLNKIPIRDENSIITGIRVISKLESIESAIKYTAEVSKLGYYTFLQVVSITDYKIDDLYRLIKLFNNTKINFISIVDTYGVLYPKQLYDLIRLFDKNLKKSKGIGFHGHNNLQLAFANSIEFVNYPTTREKIIDGTILGMGRSAGNAPLELIANYLNNFYSTNYNIEKILDFLEYAYVEFKERYKWGYSIKFYISSITMVHPNYVSYLLDKESLITSQIINILRIIPDSLKLRFDQDYIQSCYIEYQASLSSSNNRDLFNFNYYKKIILFAPGLSECNFNEVNLLKNTNSITIGINHYPSLPIDAVLITKQRRYMQSTEMITRSDSLVKLITSDNIVERKSIPHYSIPYIENLAMGYLYNDNPLFILLNQLIRTNFSGEIHLYGFDGYNFARESNYVSPEMEYHFTKNMANNLNKDVISFLSNVQNDLDLTFHGQTLYKDDLLTCVKYE